jgi:EAL domain-containing protein (putative c-di-GMP-specific phosphodiesterase class I)
VDPLGASDPNFTFAFQPIVDSITCEVVSYEALIRGSGGESAYQVLGQVPQERLLEFDQKARARAIALAARLGIGCNLNLNFMPQSLRSPESILSGLEAANRAHLPVEHLIVEVTEGAAIGDHAYFTEIVNEHRGLGLKFAIDDFGAGYSGLNLLADFQPDLIKLDLKLVRGIERLGPRQAIVRGVAQVCFDLGIDVIAEGVETVEEYAWLAHAGIRLFQGFLFARPGLESFPPVHYPESCSIRSACSFPGEAGFGPPQAAPIETSEVPADEFEPCALSAASAH